MIIATMIACPDRSVCCRATHADWGSREAPPPPTPKSYRVICCMGILLKFHQL